MSLYYNYVNSYLFVNGQEIFKFKADNKNGNFPTQFCLGNTSNGFGVTDSREVSLKGNVNDFSVNYNASGKSGVLNICNYLLVRLIKQVFIELFSFTGSLRTTCMSLNNEQCMTRPTQYKNV